VTSEGEALAFLEGIRAQHRMARHHVYAYVVREGGRVRYSDDGEPAKTAGLPVLEAVQHAGLSDVIVVVTRYFGGTLLGTGGLVRAYTQAAQAAIDGAVLLRMSPCVDVELRVSYADYERAAHAARLAGASVGSVDFGEDVLARFTVPADEQELVGELAALLRGSEEIVVSAPYWAALTQHD